MSIPLLAVQRHCRCWRRSRSRSPRRRSTTCWSW